MNATRAGDMQPAGASSAASNATLRVQQQQQQQQQLQPVDKNNGKPRDQDLPTTTPANSTTTTEASSPAAAKGDAEAEDADELHAGGGEDEDIYEAQANVQSSALADPNSSLGNSSLILVHPKEEDEEEDAEEGEDVSSPGGEQLERRTSSSLTNEVRKFRQNQRNKLASRRRRRKKPPSSQEQAANKKRKSLVKSALTRQSQHQLVPAGSNHNQVGLKASEVNSGWPPGLASSPQKHPLPLSSAVQRLFFDKFHHNQQHHKPSPPMSLNQQLAVLEQQEAARNGIFLQHPNGFTTPLLGSHQPELLSQWLAQGGDNLAASSGNIRAKQANQQGPGGPKIIPIEIIGLDPMVTRSILQTEASTEGSAAAAAAFFGPSPGGGHLAASHELPEAVLQAGQQAANGKLQTTMTTTANTASSTRQVPSIVHVHHFHTQQQAAAAAAARAPASGQTAAQEQAQGQQQQVAAAASPLPPHLFVNDKGELVYLAEAGGGGQVEQQGGSGDFGSPLAGERPSGGDGQQTMLGEHQQDAAQVSVAGPELGPEPPQQVQVQEGVPQAPPPPPPPPPGAVNLSPGEEQFGSTGQLETSIGQQLAASRQPQVFLTTDGQTISVQPAHLEQQQQQVRQRPELGPAMGNAKLLMVAYKPQQQHQQARNLSQVVPTGAYNEGQESSLVSAGQLVLRPLSSLLLDPAGGGARGASANHHNATNSPPNQTAKPAAAPAPPPATTGDNRVPSLVAHYDASALMKKAQLASSLAAASSPPAESGEPAVTKVRQLLPSLQMVSQPQNHNQPKLANYPQFFPNGTLKPANLSEEILKKLLRELKLNNHQSSAAGASLQNFSSSSGLPLADHTASGSSSLDHQLVVANAAGKPAPKNPRLQVGPNQQTNRQILPQNQQRANLRLLQTRPPPPPPQATSELDAATGNHLLLAGDSQGLGNIALAFIFVVSLLTLTIIAASMIYRHKRRSLARCSSLPPRSRGLNLTQRTKRFMRSNFVHRPGSGHHQVADARITPIRSTTNLQADNKAASNGSGKSRRSPPSVVCRAAADGYPIPGSKLTTFTSLAQFGAAEAESQTGGDMKAAAAADIKTLNTRLQKSTYLKSLISSAPANGSPPVAAGCKQQQQQIRTGSKDSQGSFCYLNIRHKSPAAVAAKSSSAAAKTAELSEREYKRSQSFKRLGSDLHNYSFAFKGNQSALNDGSDRLSVDSKGGGRMSTIHSISDNNGSKSTKITATKYNARQESPGQVRRPSAAAINNNNNISHRASELNLNLMGQPSKQQQQQLGRNGNHQHQHRNHHNHQHQHGHHHHHHQHQHHQSDRL